MMYDFKCDSDAGRAKMGYCTPCNGVAIPSNPFTRRWECWFCGGLASAPPFRENLRLRWVALKRLAFKFLRIDPNPDFTWVFKCPSGKTRKLTGRDGKWKREENEI